MPDYSQNANIPLPQGNEAVTRALYIAAIQAIDDVLGGKLSAVDLNSETIIDLIKEADGAGSGLDADKLHGADGATVCLFKSGSGVYTDNDTSQAFVDVFCTENSLVTVVITSGTPAGTWTVDSANGSFTIASTAAESADIAFDYYVQKAVG